MLGMVHPRSPQDPNPSVISYKGSEEPPTQTYAKAYSYGSLGTPNSAASSTPWTKSAMVTRIPRRQGMRYFYGYGAQPMPLPNPYPGGNDGQVRISAFQRYMNHLYNFVKYDGLFSAGYPRNLGLTFRVQQIKTQVTGGSWNAAMSPAPVFPKVQTTGRYSTVPRAYNTTAAKT